MGNRHGGPQILERRGLVEFITGEGETVAGVTVAAHHQRPLGLAPLRVTVNGFGVAYRNPCFHRLVKPKNRAFANKVVSAAVVKRDTGDV